MKTANNSRGSSVQRRVAELQSNQGGYSFQGSSSIQQNDYDTITASNYGARSHRKFVKRGDRNRRGHSKSSLMAPASTVASTLSNHFGVGRAYLTGTNFAQGPAYHIQSKKKQDSMFLSKIAQNEGPGPAKYNGHSSGIGGTS